MTEQRRQGKLRRRLTLSHDGRPFLDRWGLVHERVGGFYLHHIAGPDPGKDLHDHPWAFISIVLRGGYTEQHAPTAIAVDIARSAEMGHRWGTDRKPRVWRRWTVHRMPLSIAHRIVNARRNTWTLVLRGPTRRVWNFYPPTGKVAWTEYDYAARRPSSWKSNY